MTEYLLTTVDNPYNPFTEWEEWYAYDIRKGHHTLAFLARLTRSADDLSEIDQALAIRQAIDEIVKENISGIYRKISRTGPIP